eukprot:TRINITY_DN30486_c0_g1_i1.p1 TRINITY_DN30486_c0_g1~~TRINITY_DN30486_c0_g1_i1.p1  ORF type:complete len:433 (-),score=96.54 TRINITY_DN30486_c0_g1_i1:255-1553(-)
MAVHHDRHWNGLARPAISKHEYILEHLSEAHRAFSGDDGFRDENALLTDLRSVFDWIAQEKAATRVQRGRLARRRPELNKLFPEFAKRLLMLEMEGGRWLELDEFLAFCLKDDLLQQQLEKARAITVYGIEAGGKRTVKDQHDRLHMVETGVPAPLLPWETSHRIEWRIVGMRHSQRGSPVTYGGMRIAPGVSIQSPPFQGGGINGTLRLWPAGYHTTAQTQLKQKMVTLPGGACCDDPPAGKQWCCVGLCGVPAGTCLVVRFFIGDMMSARRRCTWSEGHHTKQVWAPLLDDVPQQLIEATELTVGVEIFANHGSDATAIHRCPADWRAAARKRRRPTLHKGGEPSLPGTRSLPSLWAGPRASSAALSGSASLTSLGSLGLGGVSSVSLGVGSASAADAASASDVSSPAKSSPYRRSMLTRTSAMPGLVQW